MAANMKFLSSSLKTMPAGRRLLCKQGLVAADRIERSTYGL